MSTAAVYMMNSIYHPKTIVCLLYHTVIYIWKKTIQNPRSKSEPQHQTSMHCHSDQQILLTVSISCKPGWHLLCGPE